MGLRENIEKVRSELDAAARAAGRDPGSVALLAATKTQTSDAIRAAIAAGITVCGENRVQELTAHLADNAYEGASSSFSEDTEWISAALPTTYFTLLVWRWPMKWTSTPS